jgi:hypothetical protein
VTTIQTMYIQNSASQIIKIAGIYKLPLGFKGLVNNIICGPKRSEVLWSILKLAINTVILLLIFTL